MELCGKQGEKGWELLRKDMPSGMLDYLKKNFFEPLEKLAKKDQLTYRAVKDKVKIWNKKYPDDAVSEMGDLRELFLPLMGVWKYAPQFCDVVEEGLKREGY